MLAYAINGERSFDYQHGFGTVLNKQVNGTGMFDGILRVDDFYVWATTVLAPSIRVSTYYNNQQAYYMAGFLGDFSSRLV